MKFGEYATATVTPVKYNILGLTLKPLCLGHYLNMRAYGCEYASDTDTEVGIIDLIIGVLVCSMTYEQFKDFVDSDRFLPEVRRWGNIIRKDTKKDKHFNVFEKLAEFKRYLEDGQKFPHIEPTNNDNQNVSNSHWSLRISTILLSKLNLSHTEVMNMPLTEAVSLCFQYLELEGVATMTDSPQEQYAGYIAEINKLKKEVV